MRAEMRAIDMSARRRIRDELMRYLPRYAARSRRCRQRRCHYFATDTRCHCFAAALRAFSCRYADAVSLLLRRAADYVLRVRVRV